MDGTYRFRDFMDGTYRFREHERPRRVDRKYRDSVFLGPQFEWPFPDGKVAQAKLIGSPAATDEGAKKSGKRWHRGQRAARGLYLVASFANAPKPSQRAIEVVCVAASSFKEASRLRSLSPGPRIQAIDIRYRRPEAPCNCVLYWIKNLEHPTKCFVPSLLSLRSGDCSFYFNSPFSSPTSEKVTRVSSAPNSRMIAE